MINYPFQTQKRAIEPKNGLKSNLSLLVSFAN